MPGALRHGSHARAGCGGGGVSLGGNHLMCCCSAAALSFQEAAVGHARMHLLLLLLM